MKGNKNLSVLLNVICSGGIKFLALLVSLMTTTAYMKYFNNDNVLGVWFTILSIITWILTFDLGIGNGLRNNLVSEIELGNKEKIKKYICTSYYYVAKIAVFAFLIGIIIIFITDFNKILNIDSLYIDGSTLKIVFAICFVSIIVEFVLKLVQSILNAYQKNAIANALSLLTSVIILIFVSIVKPYSATDGIIILSIIYFFALNLPLLTCTIIVLKKIFGCNLSLISLFFDNKFVDKKLIKKIMNLGILFFIIQLSLVVINSTDSFFISNIFGSIVVVNYQIYYKLYSIFIMGSAVIAAPIWSMITKSYVQKDFKWIKKSILILFCLFLCFLVSIVVFSLIIQFIINVWMKENAIVVDSKIVLVFSLYTILLIFINLASSIANGLNAIKSQIIITLIGALVKLPIILLLKKIDFDWIIVIIADIAVLCPLCIGLPIEIMLKLKKKEIK